MDANKEQLLKKTYEEYIDLMLYDFPIDRIEEIFAVDVTGYGTTIDEKFLEISAIAKIITDQRTQSEGMEMQVKNMPLHRRISPDEDISVFMDEFEVSMLVDGSQNLIPLRLTSVFEFRNNLWKLVHLHGSKAVETVGDTWHINEWKQKNAELQKLVDEKTIELTTQNRDLEIEASLERVRTVAMSMRQPDDMLKVCQVISDQLQQLNVQDIRNVQTAIIYENKGTYLNYEYYAKHDKLLVTEVDFKNHELQSLFANQMLHGAEELFATALTGKEVQDWYEYQKTTNQFADSFLENAQSLHYYFYSLGPVALGISTYSPLSEVEINLFKRFRNVFDLAYRRFLDIEKAESQAREAQIELGLERVRARAMAMQNSNELAELVATLFKELTRLDFALTRCYIYIIDPDSLSLRAWTFNTEVDEIPESYQIQYLDLPYYKALIKAWRERKQKFVYELGGAEKLEVDRVLLTETEYSRMPEQVKSGMKSVDRVFLSYSFNNFGGLQTGGLEPLSDENLDIFSRFGKVFDLTYTRFNDLKQAEAQAREAQIQLALERVRARTMAMQSSEELSEVSFLLNKQVVELGIPTRGCAFNIYNEHDSTEWFANLEGTIPVYKTPRENIFLKYYEAGRRGETLLIEEFGGERIKEHYKYLATLPVSGKKDGPIASVENAPAYQIDHVAYFKYGYLLFITLIPAPEAHEVFKRFAREFEQTYTRFLDLKKAEAQARESRIEAGLERVRSRTMGMQHSDELQEAAVLLFQQVIALGVPAFATGFNIWDDDRKSVTAWMGGQDRMQPPFKTSGSEDIFQRIYEAAQRGDSLFVEEQGGEALKMHYEYMKSIPVFKAIADKMAAAGQSFPTFQIMHSAFFSHGYLMFISYEPVPEAYDIFKRFAKVFGQTYTRFLDLQKAEAQAREVVKQTSLDRVRGEIASMRTVQDLQRITPIIWHELITLDVPVIRCGVFIIDEEQSNVQVYLTTPEVKPLAVLNLSFDSNELTSNTVDHWRKSIVYKEHWNKEQFIQWTQSMLQLGQIKDQEAYQGSENPPETLDLHFVPFAQGMLYVGNTSPLSDEKIQLVQSLADAFSIAYARYEDFNKLEKAKASIESTLTELRATQSQLIQSEKMASLGELTAGIAHEIQNPLNFVNNFSEVSNELLDEMKTELDNGDFEEAKAIASDVKLNLDKILHHGKRADAIVKGMLQHSRSSNGAKEPTDINALVDEYLRLAYHGLRAKDKSFIATLKTDFDETIGKIDVIPQDIGRVILNLITNAFYAVNEKKQQLPNGYEPTVSVSTKVVIPPPAGGGSKGVKISIKDNGPGIPQNIVDKIFQPFFTTKPTGSGTGLGLSLSYDIVKAHGGELKVETKEGVGSVFTIII